MKSLLLIGFLLHYGIAAQTQLIYYKNQIVSPYTIANEAATKRKQQVWQQANNLNTLPIGSDDETSYPIDVALWNVSQFKVRTPQSDSGVARLVKNYEALRESTQRALLEVVYGLYPGQFLPAMRAIAAYGGHPRNFAMAALHVYNAEPTEETRQWIRSKMNGVSGNEGQQIMLQVLSQYIHGHKPATIPSLDSLFARQQIHKFKIVYSFQRANRDFPGLAIVQNTDGSFARDSLGQLRTFVQLARSASNLPYFLTNGSTPQGLYTIMGTAVSKNVFIGPTPNLHTAMMYEVNPPTFTHYFPIVFNAPPERIYRSYFPENWQKWSGIMEACDAGRIGRSEIIAHGSTIDPEWFKDEPYYPLSPTLGCLSGLELWNKQTGHIDRSDQLDLVNCFIETKGTKGYLMVINLDDKKMPVSKEELEVHVNHFSQMGF